MQGLVAAECAAGVDAWVWAINGGEPWVEGVRCVGGIADFSEAERIPLPHFFRVNEFDLVHIHGIWSWKLHRVAVMCRKAGVPYVIAPRGMLEPWSLKQKGLKKRIARFLYQDRDLRLAAALHATAESEAEQFRKLGFRNKIIVSPNGVNVPEGKVERKGGGGQRRALFVSRMHPKKGVLELVESWARAFKEKGKVKNEKVWTCELVYTMNSDEERAYEKRVKQRILDLGMSYGEMAHGALSVRSGKDSASPLLAGQSPDFIFTGALDDEKKWEAYGRADLFVLPTYSENFGIVVAEALWAGVPVITTKGTPWKDLEDYKCGWWIDLPDEKVEKRGEGGQWNALESALREACGADDLREKGARGRQLVGSKYTWTAVVNAMVEGYANIA